MKRDRLAHCAVRILCVYIFVLPCPCVRAKLRHTTAQGFPEPWQGYVPSYHFSMYSFLYTTLVHWFSLAWPGILQLLLGQRRCKALSSARQ